MKKHIKLAAVLTALMLCLAACGASSGSTVGYTAQAPSHMTTQLYKASDADYASVTQYEESTTALAEDTSNGAAAIAGGAAIGDTADAAEQAERKIVYTGSMNLQTKEFDKALEDITALIKESGGYISAQETNGRSLTGSGYYSRYASMTVRVPADRFDALMTGMSGICNVTEQSVWTDDISDTYYDAEAHLSTLRLQEERLLDILSKAEKLDDIISLESALSDVRYQIESITAQLRRMDNSVSYSTLTLYISEVVEYSEQSGEPATFIEKLGEAAKRSGRSIADFFENLVLWIVADLPLVLLWAVLIIAVLWLVVRVLRLVFRRDNKFRLPRRKKSSEQSEKPAAEEKTAESDEKKE